MNKKIDLSTPKECVSCGQLFPRTKDYWHQKKGNLDDLSNVCKTCFKEKSRKRNADKKDAFALSQKDVVLLDPEIAPGEIQCRTCKFREECMKRLWTLQELVCERPDETNLRHRNNYVNVRIYSNR